MAKRTGIQLIDNNDDGTIMDIKIQPKYDATGKIVSGLVVGDTLEQNKALILISQPGENKFRPDVGVGLGDLALSEDYLEYRHKIREHFEKDGLKASNVQLYKDKPLKIEADYGNS